MSTHYSPHCPHSHKLIFFLLVTGNNHTYLPQGGNNIISSALHWGPDPANDNWWQNNEKLSALHSTYSGKYHTFGLEWSEKYIFTYVDTRLLQVLYTVSPPPHDHDTPQLMHPHRTSTSLSGRKATSLPRHPTAQASWIPGLRQDETQRRLIRTSTSS